MRCKPSSFLRSWHDGHPLRGAPLLLPRSSRCLFLSAPPAAPCLHPHCSIPAPSGLLRPSSPSAVLPIPHTPHPHPHPTPPPCRLHTPVPPCLRLLPPTPRPAQHRPTPAQGRPPSLPTRPTPAVPQLPALPLTRHPKVPPCTGPTAAHSPVRRTPTSHLPSSRGGRHAAAPGLRGLVSPLCGYPDTCTSGSPGTLSTSGSPEPPQLLTLPRHPHHLRCPQDPRLLHVSFPMPPWYPMYLSPPRHRRHSTLFRGTPGIPHWPPSPSLSPRSSARPPLTLCPVPLCTPFSLSPSPLPTLPLPVSLPHTLTQVSFLPPQNHYPPQLTPTLSTLSPWGVWPVASPGSSSDPREGTTRY